MRPALVASPLLCLVHLLACSPSADDATETEPASEAAAGTSSAGASGAKPDGGNAKAAGVGGAGGSLPGSGMFPGGGGASAAGGKAGAGTAGTAGGTGGAGQGGGGAPGGGASGSNGAGKGGTSSGGSGVGSSAGSGAGGKSSAGAGGAGSAAGQGVGGNAGAGATGGSAGTCSPWVFMGDDPNACVGHLGASCGWTASNEGQGYHCQTVSWGVGCEPGGGGCGSGTGGTGAAGTGAAGSGSAGSGSGGASTGAGLGSILSEATFNAMFPGSHLPIYSYQGLLDAAAKYPAFGGTGSSDQAKREVAAFLANVAHETGDLQYADEIAKADYCQSSGSCPCEPGQQYFGRGALQLSWNYNYCAAGDALGYDLRKNPGQVSSNPTLIWLTGMWFWMTSTGAGSQTCHDGIASSGFGATIKTINGALECGGQNGTQVQDRITHYQTFCKLLGVAPGGSLTC